MLYLTCHVLSCHVSSHRVNSGQVIYHESCKSGSVRGLQSNRAAAVGEMHEAKVQADKAVRRKKAINILSEARKEAHQQVSIWLCILICTM